MDYPKKWCMRCGALYGNCNHKDCKTTKNEEEAIRIRLVYKGILIEKEPKKC
jgi:hypothetical protein